MKHNITLKNCIRKEPVLCTAALLAALSALVVLPDPSYAGYIDFRTLAILFSLMTVMAGLRGQGVFSRMGQALLGRTGGVFPLVLVLVGLCFFGSMLITNDVALLTFVPFTFAVLGRLEPKLCRALAVPVVCMQTVAANLGSMLTPIGNPQNLYLYGKSNMPLAQFVRLMLPYSLLSLGLLLVWAFGVCRTLSLGAAPRTLSTGHTPIESPRLVGMYAVLFCVCLGTVARLVPCGVSFAAFFIFIGNLGRVPAFSAWLQGMIAGREVPVAVLASQLTSNVPAALLLSGFTQNTAALIIGTNLGGLGTLIASMASLISYRQIAQELPQQKGRYFVQFTVSNLVFLAILMAAWLIFG